MPTCALSLSRRGDAEIRIAFRPEEGSWSRLGTDALVFPQSQWTMNFGWLTPTTLDVEYSRVVIHEFGHALSCIHEHQNPIARIPWDKPGVYAYYARQGWPKADVDHNVFQAYSRDLTQFTEFDPKSIMLYAVPNELTVGDFEIGWNAALSDTDKLFIDTMYPSTSKPEIDLQVGGLAVQESIGKHGEEDLFGFSASVKGGTHSKPRDGLM